MAPGTLTNTLRTAGSPTAHYDVVEPLRYIYHPSPQFALMIRGGGAI
jgi:hypothetical protein